MDSKRINDITLLNNQIIILDAWNKWKVNTEANYEARINNIKEKIAAQEAEATSLKRAEDSLDYGRSLGALILVILCAIFYIVPMFVDPIKQYAPYFAMATVLFVIPYVMWIRGSKKTFIAHLLYWISNGLFLGGTLYFLSIRDGQPNIYYALFHNPRFEQISRLFTYISLGSIVLLLATMIIRKILLSKAKARINRALYDCESTIKDETEQVQNLTNEKEELLVNKEKEYFDKYPIALPNYPIKDIQILLQYMVNHRADTIKEAINLMKQEEALHNIQDDVKVLRQVQDKTTEEINAMKKEKENKEKEGLVY